MSNTVLRPQCHKNPPLGPAASSSVCATERVAGKTHIYFSLTITPCPLAGGLTASGQGQLSNGATGWPCSRLLWKEPSERPLGAFPNIIPNLYLSSGPRLWSLLELHCNLVTYWLIWTTDLPLDLLHCQAPIWQLVDLLGGPGHHVWTCFALLTWVVCGGTISQGGHGADSLLSASAPSSFSLWSSLLPDIKQKEILKGIFPSCCVSFLW